MVSDENHKQVWIFGKCVY